VKDDRAKLRQKGQGRRQAGGIVSTETRSNSRWDCSIADSALCKTDSLTGEGQRARWSGMPTAGKIGENATGRAIWAYTEFWYCNGWLEGVINLCMARG